MSLSVHVRKRLAAFTLDCTFEAAGRLTALFGASGSGKTSVINMIGGLMKPDEGRIVVDGRVLVDMQARSFVPPHKRRVGYVFQDARLFPHLTVTQNLHYGRFFTPTAERKADLDRIIDLLGLEHLLDRKPHHLSGGEKQRVAIGRALASSPRLLLMDEPLASLDDARKAEILPYIEQLRDQSETPIVYVSHSIAEVARLATDVVMMEAGKVLAHGATNDMVSRFDLIPASERHEGGAIIAATVTGHFDEGTLTVVQAKSGEWRLPGAKLPTGTEVRLRVRARDVMVATEWPNHISALNIIAGTVTRLDGADAAETLVFIDCSGDQLVARITAYSAKALGLRPGTRVHALVKAVAFDPV